MSIKVEVLRNYIKEIIKQELDEASVTGNIDGGEGPPKTPYAFQGKRKKDKEKENKIATNSTGYSKVNEAVLTLSYQPIFDKSKKDELVKLAKKSALTVRGSGGKQSFTVDGKFKNIEKFIKSARGMLEIKESINEGKYHDYRNDDTLTAKQKIGRSMREVRDSLLHLEGLVKMNVKLKNELNVDSRSYWKNTHKALNKISERLVKLANKVGQLQ